MDAIWTDEQVANLNKFQHCGRYHPFTCGSSDAVPDCRETLVATPNGWVCANPRCTYTQNWAHAEIMNGELLRDTEY